MEKEKSDQAAVRERAVRERVAREREKESMTALFERRLRVWGGLMCLCMLILTMHLCFSGGLPRLDAEMDAIHEQGQIAVERERTQQGSIWDANGEAIFVPPTEDSEGTPLSEAYGLLVGYDDAVMRSGGLMHTFQSQLWQHGPGSTQGQDLQLTTVNRLQEAAYAALAGDAGSCIILDNHTSAILALASREEIPFDPQHISAEKFAEYDQYDGFWLLNGTTEQDPPGSVFKLVTTVAALEQGLEPGTYEDSGCLTLEDGGEIHNFQNQVFGSVDLESAFTNSVNTYFASLALEVGATAMSQTLEDFLLGQDIELDIGQTLTSSYEISSVADLARCGFGQGKTALTPLHIAMIGQAIASGGEMGRPYLVQTVDARKYSHPETLATCCRKDTAREVRRLMQAAAADYGLQAPTGTDYIGAKTGTAELSDDPGAPCHIYLLVITDDHTLLLNKDRTTAGSHSLIEPMQSLLMLL